MIRYGTLVLEGTDLIKSPIMNAEEFIDTIKEVVSEDSVRNVQSVLLKPPGRKPSDNVTAMSKWYNNLNDGDRSMVITS